MLTNTGIHPHDMGYGRCQPSCCFVTAGCFGGKAARCLRPTCLLRSAIICDAVLRRANRPSLPHSYSLTAFACTECRRYMPLRLSLQPVKCRLLKVKRRHFSVRFAAFCNAKGHILARMKIKLLFQMLF